MAAAGIEQLPEPQLGLRSFGAQALPLFTDEALFQRTGLRVAFSGRAGGVSEGAYASLNLGGHVGDDQARVDENRRILLSALDASDAQLVVPSQVHGKNLVPIDSDDPQLVDAARARAKEGADGIVVSTSGVAALLCYADCVPVVIASPTGRFAVVHAGWRGVMNGIAPVAVQRMAAADGAALGADAAAEYNVYIGPHIHVECFETGEDVRARFVERFGAACAPDARHVDLFKALCCGLAEVGVRRERVVEAGVCTMCNPDRYYSYRAAGGVCGRHGAIAFRKDG